MAMADQTNCVNGINLDILKDTVKSIEHDADLGKCRFHVHNHWSDATHNYSTITSFYGAKQEIAHKQRFELHADEPALLAGKDGGANPVEHLLNALASCVTTSIIAHAAVRGIEIYELESEIEGDIDLRGFLGLDSDIPKGYTDIRMTYKVKTAEEDLAKLKALAEYSPVFNTITQGANVDIQVLPK